MYLLEREREDDYCTKTNWVGLKWEKAAQSLALFNPGRVWRHGCITEQALVPEPLFDVTVINNSCWKVTNVQSGILETCLLFGKLTVSVLTLLTFHAAPSSAPPELERCLHFLSRI